MLLIASKPTLPYPLHCFVLVYVSNCAQHCRCFCAGGPFMTRPLCSRLNIRRRKKRSAINVHPLLHASCMPFRPYLPTLKLLELSSLTGSHYNMGKNFVSSGHICTTCWSAQYELVNLRFKTMSKSLDLYMG